MSHLPSPFLSGVRTATVLLPAFYWGKGRQEPLVPAAWLQWPSRGFTPGSLGPPCPHSSVSEQFGLMFGGRAGPPVSSAWVRPLFLSPHGVRPVGFAPCLSPESLLPKCGCRGPPHIALPGCVLGSQTPGEPAEEGRLSLACGPGHPSSVHLGPTKRSCALDSGALPAGPAPGRVGRGRGAHPCPWAGISLPGQARFWVLTGVPRAGWASLPLSCLLLQGGEGCCACSRATPDQQRLFQCPCV